MEIPKEVRDLFKEKGKQGGNNTLKKYGTEHYSRMGKARGKKLSPTPPIDSNNPLV